MAPYSNDGTDCSFCFPIMSWTTSILLALFLFALLLWVKLRRQSKSRFMPDKVAVFSPGQVRKLPPLWKDKKGAPQLPKPYLPSPWSFEQPPFFSPVPTSGHLKAILEYRPSSGFLMGQANDIATGKRVQALPDHRIGSIIDEDKLPWRRHSYPPPDHHPQAKPLGQSLHRATEHDMTEYFCDGHDMSIVWRRRTMTFQDKK